MKDEDQFRHSLVSTSLIKLMIKYIYYIEAKTSPLEKTMRPRKKYLYQMPHLLKDKLFIPTLAVCEERLSPGTFAIAGFHARPNVKVA